jgi:hypothetical protein
VNPLHLVLALGPVAIYLFVLSGILFGRHPTVVSGARDSLALALACLGFVALGPLRLFMPEQSAYLGSWVWLPLVALYGLGALLVVMLLRPRLVVYWTTWPGNWMPTAAGPAPRSSCPTWACR